ncbi:hypothetical protein CLAVI_000917 [Candidatus Clavichlamydia salmonicola]|uniref:hypothetical protein n=1 Tax=Candidatus Clavichlamydia salmonicola TaxID=469812 RepID=UPI001891DB18|nr:hypothetical protein [Candidatus Clavichlamydia salmonicola]MBF5051276.1 hypothetical protein [Candidatus Clavichlamydia salmonicola]
MIKNTFNNNSSSLNSSVKQHKSTKKITIFTSIIVALSCIISAILIGLSVLHLGIGLGIIGASIGLFILIEIGLCLKQPIKQHFSREDLENITANHPPRNSPDSLESSLIMSYALNHNEAPIVSPTKANLTPIEELPNQFLQTLLTHIRTDSEAPTLNNSFVSTLAYYTDKINLAPSEETTESSLKESCQENIGLLSKSLEELSQFLHHDQHIINDARSLLEEKEDRLDYMKKALRLYSYPAFWTDDESFILVEKLTAYEEELQRNKDILMQINALLDTEKEKLIK